MLSVCVCVCDVKVIVMNEHLIANERLTLAVAPIAFIRVQTFLNRNGIEFKITNYDLQKLVMCSD